MTEPEPSTSETPIDTAAAGVESSRTSRRTVALLIGMLALHSGLVAWNDVWNSPVIDEVGHLTAGIRIWQTGQFDLYRVNPPLVKMVAALPAVLGHPNYDWSVYADSPRERHEFVVGQDFIRANGEKAFWYFSAGRLCCLPFSWIGALVCFFWAKDLYGERAGLLSALLWYVSPNVLTWAATFTPDVAASSLGLLAAWRFWRWLTSPGWRQAGIAGLALGLAELSKFTRIVLFVAWPAIWVLWWYRGRREPEKLNRSVDGWQLLTILGLGLYLLNLGYGFEGSGTKLGRFVFVSQSLTGLGRGEWGNRFNESILREIPVPLPSNYVRGIDLQKVDFEKGMDSYLLGEWRRPGGWWYYYLVCAVVKIPLGIWLLAVVRIISGQACRDSSRMPPAALLFPPAIVFVLVSSQTGFSRYFRYVLPCLPFLYVWLSGVLGAGGTRSNRQSVLAALAVLWATGSMFASWPHTLSYFNEAAGGSANGSAVLVDSNVDWGQDLFRARDWIQRHRRPNESVFVMHTGFVSPGMVGIECEWPPAAVSLKTIESLEPDVLAEMGPRPGLFVVSIHELERRIAEYEYLRQADLIDRVGYSMLVYRLDEPHCEAIRQSMQLPPLKTRAAASAEVADSDT